MFHPSFHNLHVVRASAVALDELLFLAVPFELGFGALLLTRDCLVASEAKSRALSLFAEGRAVSE